MISRNVIIKDTCTILEKFGSYYLYDGSQVEIFTDLPSLKKRLFSQKHLNIVSLNKELQSLDLDDCLEILELLVFVYPNYDRAPIISSVCEFLGLRIPTTPEEEVESVYRILEELYPQINVKSNVYQSVFSYMSFTAWPWCRVLNKFYKIDLVQLQKTLVTTPEQRFLIPLFKRIEKWDFELPKDYTDNKITKITEANVKKTLSRIVDLKKGCFREQQLSYSLDIANNFNASINSEVVNVGIYQAPTGVGKTFGYLAPSLLYAKQNRVPVWISTFTKNLQQQIQNSMSEFKDINVALRKGKQNYACLLRTKNVLDRRSHYINGFITLWLMVTKDGDIVSGDFPQWLFSFNERRSTEFVDYDSNCIYSACPYFRRCFVFSSVQNANKADIIVSNHALSVIEGTVGDGSGSRLPPIVVFDEAHELFTAADDSFSTFLSAIELRKFTDFLGLRNKKGIIQRLHEAIQSLPSDEGVSENISKIINLGKYLPYQDWSKRLSAGIPMENEKNISQKFFYMIYKTVLQNKKKTGYSNLELEIDFLFKENNKNGKSLRLVKEASDMLDVLTDINKNLSQINNRIDILLNQYCDDDSDYETSFVRQKLTGIQNSIRAKQSYFVRPWINSLEMPEDEKFATFLEVSIGAEGRIFDLGIKRHFINPMRPFARHVLNHIKSVNMTSATIADQYIAKEENFETTLKTTGVDYIDNKKLTIKHYKSPFDYQKQTRILIIEDVNYKSKSALGKAFGDLFLANKGKSLGIFTAISRLKGIYEYLSKTLKENEINLYAQHVQSLDVSTLVNIFKEDKTSCLIGTDALRQGVDITGESLSLVVCDKLPRPVPSIMMKSREKKFGKKYRNTITATFLKQAFGRLIRTENDKGFFVLLDPRINRAELRAFPENVEIKRVKLQEAIDIIKAGIN